jgi:hypothetical protein
MTGDSRQYFKPCPLGVPMRANTIGIVEKSNSLGLPVGSYILGYGLTQDYYITNPIDPSTSRVIEIPGVPITAFLSILSLATGVTAWATVRDVLNMQPGNPDFFYYLLLYLFMIILIDIIVITGETVVVTAGAGSVGSLTCQLAKLRGCTVIATVGTKEKAAYVMDVLGIDAVINYRTENVQKRLMEIAPYGIDCFVDSVGGAVADAVYRCMKNFGRVAYLGYIDGYNSETSTFADYSIILKRRLSLHSVLCTDHVGMCVSVCVRIYVCV